MKPNTSLTSTSIGAGESNWTRSGTFLPAIIGGSVAHFGGQYETDCTTLWDRGSLSIHSWDDDAHGGVFCTASVQLGSHKRPEDLSESALSRIISFIVLTYMGDKAVKEAATTLLDIHQHYKAVEAASAGRKMLPGPKIVAAVRAPTEGKVFEVD
jgi:hypothetical protein